MQSKSSPVKEPTEKEARAILERLQIDGHVSEALVQEQLRAVRGGIHGDTHTRVKGAAQVQEKRELEPAQIEQLVGQLKANFTSNGKEFPQLHPNVKWAEVEASLRAQPKMMWSLSKMEETGGKVDVTGEDDSSFLFVDTSKESPDGRRNVVFDKKAEGYSTAGTFNGNADDRVKEWGVDFMDIAQYRAMQEHGDFDARTWSWLKTPAYIRATGCALRGDRDGADVRVHPLLNACDHSGDRGFRCALRVPKKV